MRWGGLEVDLLKGLIERGELVMEKGGFIELELLGSMLVVFYMKRKVLLMSLRLLIPPIQINIIKSGLSTSTYIGYVF